MTYYLSITVLPNTQSIESGGIFLCDCNIPWIYAYSDYGKLEQIRAKILSWTPQEHLRYLSVFIGETSMMPDSVRDNNKSVGKSIELDWFYIEGVVNNNRSKRVKVEEFELRHWKWW